MLSKAFVSCVALLAAITNAAPTSKRQSAVPTSANIEVITGAGQKYDLLDTGLVNIVKAAGPVDMPNMPVVPVPAGRFTINTVAGEGEDVLVTINTFGGVCRLANEVLKCFDVTEEDGPEAVFRAKLLEDGRWTLLGGHASFSIDALASGAASISTAPTFDIPAELFLNPIDGGMTS